MNLHQLEYIIALDELKSFTKAAERCFVTQATLSSMVKKLEEELQTTLFDRKHTPIITTDCGQEIIAKAREIVLQAEELRQLSLSSKTHIRGHLRIGIIPTVASSLLPIVLQPILKLYPDLSLSIVEVTTANLIEQLKNGHIDVGIAATPLATEAVEDKPLYFERLLLYGDIADDNEYILSKSLQNSSVWMLSEGNCLRNQLINVCKLDRQQMASRRLSLEASSLDTLTNMVDVLSGFTLLPELFVNRLSELKSKRIRNLMTPQPVRQISLLYYRPFAKKRLIDMLLTEIPRLVQPHLSIQTFDSSLYQIAGIT